MALGKCRECGREVSSDAKTCPGCGVAHPTRRAGLGCGAGCLGLLVVGALFSAIGRGTSSSPTSSLKSDVASAAAPAAPVDPNARAALIAAMGSGSCRPSKSHALAVVKRHPEWSNDDLWVVACHHFRQGMTGDQVIASIGRPDRVNTTVVGDRREEQWVYGESTYIYVEDGVVTSYQTSQ